MTDTQTQKFKQNWEQNYALFGQNTWEQEPDFCHYIEAPIPLDLAEKIYQQGQQFKTQNNLSGGRWLTPETLHLTIALPGRLGTHFQKNDLPFMKQTLQAISAKTPALELEIQNLNVFATTLFAEVHDPSGRLQQLHETLCNEIPFSQHPEFRYQNYLPHISLAYGSQAAPPLTAATNRTLSPQNFTLNTLSLGRAKWQGQTLKKVQSAQYQLH